jgi:Ferredoxin-like domain in Api92-like protein
MPNWVYNGLTIEGSPEQVTKLVEQMNQPFKKIADNWNMETKQMEVQLYTYPNPVFAFHNIYNHTQAGISDEEYIKQPDHTLPIQEAMMFKGNHWYDFNVREWGTKWDVAVGAEDKYPDTYIEGPTENGENLVVYYNMNTAWSPPMPAISKLSAQYPSLLFTLSYEEETGWGGECEFLRGEMISQSEYGWKCRECDNEEEDTPYCEECDFDTCPSCGYNESDEPCAEHREEVNA